MINDNIEFNKRLCPHRGVGIENTLEAIKSAIKLNPFLVEFDIQEYKHRLFLGHPPKIDMKADLSQALSHFNKTTTLPKVDLKLSEITFDSALKLIPEYVKESILKNVLVNIDGELKPEQFMLAESNLMKNTDYKILLNIDLGRYNSLSEGTIDNHINNLDRKPFSISPNLEDNLSQVIKYAKKHKIYQIHFWSFPKSKYSLVQLYEKMNYVLLSGLEVYFDIKNQNIIS
jgi:glycerophosphoryl diester phosphodiesterase